MTLSQRPWTLWRRIRVSEITVPSSNRWYRITPVFERGPPAPPKERRRAVAGDLPSRNTWMTNVAEEFAMSCWRREGFLKARIQLNMFSLWCQQSMTESNLMMEGSYVRLYQLEAAIMTLIGGHNHPTDHQEQTNISILQFTDDRTQCRFYELG